jgi:hypothetical protein
MGSRAVLLVSVCWMGAAAGFRARATGWPHPAAPAAAPRPARHLAAHLGARVFRASAQASEGERGAISVRVERDLAVDPQAAREAWLSYQWARGGGLPVCACVCLRVR